MQEEEEGRTHGGGLHSSPLFIRCVCTFGDAVTKCIRYNNSKIDWHLFPVNLRWSDDESITPHHTKNKKWGLSSVFLFFSMVRGLIVITLSEIYFSQKVPFYSAVVILSLPSFLAKWEPR